MEKVNKTMVITKMGVAKVKKVGNTRCQQPSSSDIRVTSNPIPSQKKILILNKKKILILNKKKSQMRNKILKLKRILRNEKKCKLKIRITGTPSHLMLRRRSKGPQRP